MASNHKPVKRLPQKPASVAPAQPSAPAVEAAAVSVSPVIEPPVETWAEIADAEIVAATPAPAGSDAPAPVAIVVSVAAGGATTEGAAFDPLALPLKTFDVWNDNVSAFMHFAKDLSGVTSVGEAVELQTRFAQECGEAFLRQSKELAEIAGKLAKFDSAKFGVALVC